MYKGDDSVVTPVDQAVEKYLSERIAALYPGAGILAEESSRSIDTRREYTFVIDPIDGTDIFSQGLPGWSISIGLLDGRWTAVAGIVFSPSMDFCSFLPTRAAGRPGTAPKSLYWNHPKSSPGGPISWSLPGSTGRWT